MIGTLTFIEGGRRQRVAVSRIEYVTADGNYSLIHFVDRGPVLISTHLKLLTSKLPDLVRIHKNTLVNPSYVERIKTTPRTEAFVCLTGGRILPVSRRRANLLSTQLC